MLRTRLLAVAFAPCLPRTVCRIVASYCVIAFALTTGCKHSKKEAAEAAADAGLKLAAISEERILAVNNASHQAPYQGPVGAVEGTVTITGDAAPDMIPYIDKIPPNCAIAANIYGKLFREGAGRTVADVLVAVTGYKGYLKAKSDHVDLTARDCAWERKTLAVTFGQRIDVRSKDARPYIPQLLGSPPSALLVAVPGGDSVPVFPQEAGHYVLIDSMRLYSKADVFVVRYPTTDITGENGRYRIEGIPVGPVTVSALLPSTNGTASKQIAVSANETVRVDLVLAFDKASFRPQSVPAKPPPGK
jgi:hypothetical protein